MGILTSLIDAKLMDDAVASGDPAKIKRIEDMYERRRIHEMRGEKRVALIMQALFGCDIPDDLKDIQL